MFAALAAKETYVVEKNFAAWKYIFASHDTILLPKNMFLSLATKKAMLTSSQCCLLKMFSSNKVSLLLCACVTLCFQKQCFFL